MMYREEERTPIRFIPGQGRSLRYAERGHPICFGYQGRSCSGDILNGINLSCLRPAGRVMFLVRRECTPSHNLIFVREG